METLRRAALRSFESSRLSPGSARQGCGRTFHGLGAYPDVLLRNPAEPRGVSPRRRRGPRGDSAAAPASARRTCTWRATGCTYASAASSSCARITVLSCAAEAVSAPRTSNSSWQSFSRRWHGGRGWGRSQLPGKPSSPVLTTQHGQRFTIHCRMQLWLLSFCPLQSTVHLQVQTSKAFSSGCRQYQKRSASTGCLYLLRLSAKPCWRSWSILSSQTCPREGPTP
uniref:2-oxoglutarate and iron-dependent oxygenase domain-containing protein 2 isoform X1 n=1 Tax=Ictidomys tridecemlineatus TaxID=43179 RepID=UPI001A9E4E50|nr:2-oxoglutarate and iron-dependent oxygenase domain-containing protein 2 isoform X1 [Ictidomys tridecemlineatus]